MSLPSAPVTPRFPEVGLPERLRAHPITAIGVCGLILAPAVLADIWVIKMTSALFFATFVLSWDVVSGYTGQISFGHAVFFGIGGYVSGLLNVYLGIHPSISIAAGVAVASIGGVVIGLPALRLTGPYFALVTLVAPFILLRVIVIHAPWTGGETGLLGASKAPSGVAGAENLFLDLLPNYYLGLAVFLLALAVCLLITRSHIGAILTAIAEEETVLPYVGLSPTKYKLFSFVVSAAIGGLAGATYVHSVAGTVSPSQILSLALSIEVIIAAIVGGRGTIKGAAVGGLVFYLLRDQLHGVGFRIVGIDVTVAQYDTLLFLVVTLAFLFFLPRGIVPWMTERLARDGS